MELKGDLETPKFKEIPVPREISQLIGMGLNQQNSTTLREIAEDIGGLGANPDLAGLAEKLKIMTESVGKTTKFLDDLAGKQTKLVEIRPDVYDLMFVGEEEELVLQPDKKIIDDPVVPKLLHAIFHKMRNSIFGISGRAESTSLENNKNAARILENCGKIVNFVYLFQDAKKIEVTIDEAMQVTLMPVVPAP